MDRESGAQEIRSQLLTVNLPAFKMEKKGEDANAFGEYKAWTLTDFAR